ncbi:MAG: T9SS type A sorting domain-containing protein [Bacteroidota bacterium]|nr:MAG: T9SS type A sorting domain-containing protein [Bacteroidota bacterium]
MKAKKLFGLIIGIISLIQVNGQEYFPIMGGTTQWNIVTQVFEGVGTYKYYANRDTSINEINYKILEEYDTDQGGIYLYDTLIHGFLREDSLNKRVFIRTNFEKTGIDKEYVYLDFSMNVGDSIKLFNVNWTGVDSLGFYKLDSIKIINTIIGERKAFYLSGPEHQQYEGFPEQYFFSNPIWIEGVGSLSNPILPYTEPSADYEQCKFSNNILSCFWKNSEKVYQSDFSLECGCDISDGWGALDDNSLLGNILLYPVPSNNTIQVCNNNPNKINVNIFDVNGNLIFSTYLEILETKYIDLSNFPSGIYSLQFIGDNQMIGIKKTIKY